MHLRYNWVARQLHRISSFQLNLELYVVICDVLIPTTLAHFSTIQHPLHHQLHMLLYAMSRALCWRFKYQLLDPQHSVWQLQHVFRSWKHWLTNWLTDWLTSCWLAHWLTDHDWLSLWLCVWLTDSLTVFLIHILNYVITCFLSCLLIYLCSI